VSSQVLPHNFYQDAALQVARNLLGMRLVHHDQGERLAGIILETEAYDGQQDLACHARVGKTQRNEVMFGPAGHAYIYFTYGMHWCLNCVTGEEGYAAAVLIRSILPIEGIATIAKRRIKVEKSKWCNGPAKLTQALGIDGQLNGIDLCEITSPLVIERDHEIPDQYIQRLPRVGISSVSEPWRSKPWRLLAQPPPEWKMD